MQLNSVRKEALNEAGVTIALVGCGDWKLIDNYKSETGFAGNIYANPDRALYNVLGMFQNLKATPSGQPKPSYITQSLFKTTFSSIKFAFTKNTANIGKQGNITQNGGDLVLGPSLTSHFIHIMQHTEDHTEVAKLMESAGVVYP